MSEPLEFAAGLRGTLLHGEPMADHVSWRAGGRARRAYAPRDACDLQAFLRTLPPAEPVLFVGLGSNLLVRDGGYAGTVVLMHDPHARPRLCGEEIYAGAAVASPKLARFAATEGFEGAEFLAGIPGTVGGALAMNAGCYGAETWDAVARVETIDASGELRVRSRDAFEVSYRHCALRGVPVGSPAREWFVGAWFRFRRGSRELARERIKELLTRRVQSQPLNLPNAGSVFRNPPHDFAARLIEACGLKGYGCGGVRVSEKHANFIVNPGGHGTAADIEAVILHVQRVVREQCGIQLVPEVQIVGERGTESEEPNESAS